MTWDADGTVAVPYRGSTRRRLPAADRLAPVAAGGPDEGLAPFAALIPAAALRNRIGEAIAALPEAERVRLATARLERQAARDGRRDARRGRMPGAKPDYLQFARHYAEAFVRELRARWPADAVATVLRRRPWVTSARCSAVLGGPLPARSESPTSEQGGTRIRGS